MSSANRVINSSRVERFPARRYAVTTDIVERTRARWPLEGRNAHVTFDGDVADFPIVRHFISSVTHFRLAAMLDAGKKNSGHGGPGYERLPRSSVQTVGRASLPAVFPAQAGVREKKTGSRPTPGRRLRLCDRICAVEHLGTYLLPGTEDRVLVPAFRGRSRVDQWNIPEFIRNPYCTIWRERLLAPRR